MKTALSRQIIIVNLKIGASKRQNFENYCEEVSDIPFSKVQYFPSRRKNFSETLFAYTQSILIHEKQTFIWQFPNFAYSLNYLKLIKSYIQHPLPESLKLSKLSAEFRAAATLNYSRLASFIQLSWYLLN